MQVEFTDRYGGHAPSWLRGCHGDCEAMGWVPLPFYILPPVPRRPAPNSRRAGSCGRSAVTFPGAAECAGSLKED